MMSERVTASVRPGLRSRAAVIAGLIAGLAPVAAAQRTDELWSQQCASCHGQDGGGDDNAKTLLDERWETDGSVRQLFEAVRTGHASINLAGGYPQMSDERAWAMVNFVMELRERDRRDRILPPDGWAKPVNSVHHAYRFEDVLKDGVQIPWSVDFLPDGRMLVTERAGRLRVLDVATGKLSGAVKGTPAVRHDGQGGLMDVAVHPNFADNGWIYLSFNDPGENRTGMTKIVRGKLEGSGDGLTWASQEVIFEAKREHYLGGGLHFGCRIVFHDGHVFFPIGERGRGEHAQDLGRPNGKVHRLRDDGSVPADNPFVNTPGAYPSIWSFGNRNPQGLVIDRATGLLWETEHAPRGGDEFNLIERGKNYGWPEISFGINYNGTEFRQPWPERSEALKGSVSDVGMPMMLWMPSIGACGLDIGRGGAFPEWQGDFFAGGLSGANVDRIRVRDGKVVEREEIVRDQGRVRDVVTGPDGSIYVVTNGPDRVFRVVPAEGATGATERTMVPRW